ncbi:MAG: MTH1187 family thiamine-binding protein [Bacteroidales bacterium]
MSVLMEFSMFPTDKGESVSEYVSNVIEVIRNEGHSYKLTAMGTIVETKTMAEALSVVQKAHDVLEKDASRIYSSIKIDVRKNKSDRLDGKIQSIEKNIGSVDH